MFEEVEVLTHSSIKISGKKVIYFDPFEMVLVNKWVDKTKRVALERKF